MISRVLIGDQGLALASQFAISDLKLFMLMINDHYGKYKKVSSSTTGSVGLMPCWS